jgi:hypothetical protein
MSEATKHPRCPFYPTFCNVESHRMPEHVWVSDPEVAAKRAHANHEEVAAVNVSRIRGTLHLPKKQVTHSGNAQAEVTHKLTPAEKQRAYRERQGETAKVANRTRMQAKRGKARAP